MRLPCPLLLLLLLSPHSSLAARILAVFPLPAKSHHILINAMIRTIVSSGHEVVLYTPYTLDKPPPGLTIVQLDNIISMDVTITKETVEAYMSYSPIALARHLLDVSGGLIENVYKNKKFLELVESTEHFDLIFLEAFYSQEPFLAFGKKFNAPIISMHPFGAYSIVNQAMGNPLNLAFIPDFGMPVSDRMSFFERLTNAYSKLMPFYYYYYHHLPAQNELMRSLFKDPTLPPLEELIQNVSIMFNNAHPNVHYAEPNIPNIIPVGGIHLQKETKPLPPEMKKFLDQATDGAIYFSLGSVMPDEKLGEEYFERFLSAFRRLPQRILWKTNAKVKNLPQNVMTVKWAPQQDVLAHPNVTVFLTHGGIFSQHEAIHAGLPVVCIPLMCDQPMNAKFYEEKQIGVRLFYNSLSPETIYEALTTVIHDPKYRDNMARMSRIYQDRPISPSDSLVFWVEYTLRHAGAHHLIPASASMPLYKLFLLDVIGTLLAPSLLSLYIIYFLFKFLYVKVFKYSTKNTNVLKRNEGPNNPKKSHFRDKLD